MSDTNKAIGRRFLEAFAAGDTVTLEQIVAEDVVDHNLVPGQSQGRQGLLAAVAMYRAGFPDMQITIDRQVAEGDLVVVTGKVLGTHQGTLMGIPATGKPATFAYMDMYRIVSGQVTETWHVEDIAGMLQQLGVVRP